MKLNHEQFIKQCLIKHKNKHNYDNTIYTRLHNLITVFCNTCKENFTQRADHHLTGKGCKLCTKKESSVTKKIFTDQANKVHNHSYDYNDVVYTHMTTKVLIKCKNNHIFKQTPFNHLKGRGCSLCNNRKVFKHTSKTFIEEAKQIHKNETYNYSLVEYINNNTRIKIICKFHGEFEQLPRAHLSGRGCVECNSKCGFSKSAFIKNSNSLPCTFYVLHCFNEDEEFYKIGITSKTVKKRYKDILKMPYKYRIILEKQGSAEEIWNLESNLKKNLKDIYSPNTPFNGSKKECFLNLKNILDSI